MEGGVGVVFYMFEVLDFVRMKDVVFGNICEGTLGHDADEKIVVWVDCFAGSYGAAVGISFYMTVGGC